MLDIQRKLLRTTLSMLDAAGAQYKIIFPDGESFGTLLVVEKKIPKRKVRSLHPRGALRDYFLPFTTDMQVGDVRQIPVGEYEIESLRSSMAAWANTTWGKGSAITLMDRKTRVLEIMRTN